MSESIFSSKSGKLVCSLCEEELGEDTPENREHQGEYHSCPVEEENKGPVTILDCVVKKFKLDPNQPVNGEHFEKAGMPMFGGCAECGESLAAYNMYPTVTGYVMCKSCVGSQGFYTVEEAFHFMEITTLEDELENEL